MKVTLEYNLPDELDIYTRALRDKRGEFTQPELTLLHDLIETQYIFYQRMVDQSQGLHYHKDWVKKLETLISLRSHFTKEPYETL